MTRPERLFLLLIGAALVLIMALGLWTRSTWETIALTASVVVSSAVLVDSALTRRDARHSLKLTLTDSRVAREELDRPLVVAYFARRQFMVDLVIENIGTAPASAIKLALPIKPESQSFQGFWSMSMMADGISFLSPTQNLRLPFQSLSGIFTDRDQLVFRGTTTYRHALNVDRVFTTDVVLDLQQFIGTHYSSKEDPAYFGANQLEKIASSLKALEKR